MYERGTTLWGKMYRRIARAARAGPSPTLVPARAGVPADAIDALSRDGVCRLGPDPAMCAIAPELWGLAAPALDGEALFEAAPAAFRHGLSPPLLDLAEAYIGEPCLYLGATLKREPADGREVGPRQWHLDIEDHRMLRVLVYLSPVGPGGGPFEYLPVAESQSVRAGQGYRSGYLTEAAMAALGTRPAWTPVFGQSGDRVAFDGTRVFHRAQPPRTETRLSITYTYSSRRPLELRLSSRLTEAARQRLLAGLDERAAACAPRRRRFAAISG